MKNKFYDNLRFYAIDAGPGDFILLYGPKGLYRLLFPGDAVPRDTYSLPYENDEDLLFDFKQTLHGFFNGKKVSFLDFECNLSWASDFTARVLNEVRLIPWGETRTYGEIAAKAGRPGAARAVGGAVGSNLLPIIIPCHRVLPAGGGIGGFGHGAEWKRKLLKLEGIEI